jgi:hypothetical protein
MKLGWFWWFQSLTCRAELIDRPILLAKIGWTVEKLYLTGCSDLKSPILGAAFQKTFPWSEISVFSFEMLIFLHQQTVPIELIWAELAWTFEMSFMLC